MNEQFPNFWEHNRIDLSFPLTADELRERFSKWIINKLENETQGAPLRYYHPDMVIRIFLSDPGPYGIGAVYGEEQFNVIREELKDTLTKHLKTAEAQEVSTLYIEGNQVEITHIGAKSLTRDAWKKIIAGLSEDLEKGRGAYALEDLQAAVEWKII